MGVTVLWLGRAACITRVTRIYNMATTVLTARQNEWAQCQHAGRKRPRSVLPAIMAVGLLLCSHPIICKLVFPKEQLSKPSIHPTPTPVPGTAWHRADMQIATKCGTPHNQ